MQFRCPSCESMCEVKVYAQLKYPTLVYSLAVCQSCGIAVRIEPVDEEE